MKRKFSSILVAALILTVLLSVFAACSTDEQSLDGMYKVKFDFNGGALRTSVTLIQDEVYQACKPNSRIIDISKYTGNKFTKDGYVFAGWFTKNGDTDGDWGKEWNFASDRVTQDVTLYAKWESEIVFSYTIYLVGDDGAQTILGTYKVREGDVFDDKYGYGTNLVVHNRTFLGYYHDEKLTEEWGENDTFTHPGGEESLDIPVYVKSMQGVWTFVSNYEELIAATGKNIWLTKSIDCGGQELSFGDYNNTLYGGGGSGLEQETLADGEWYTISNFVVPNSGNARYPEYAIFGDLGESAKIEKVNFKDVIFVIKAASDTTRLNVASLAISAADGCKIINVTVTGSYQADLSALGNSTDRQKEILAQVKQAIEDIENALFTPNENIDLSTFTAVITEQD